MYAQILKESMRVNLIGGSDLGLPIEHNSIICIDIGDNPNIKLGMVYDESTQSFKEYVKPIVASILREQAYETMVYKEDTTPLLLWENIPLTVNQANSIYLNYFIENNEKASIIQQLIITAKEYIRTLYPDA